MDARHAILFEPVRIGPKTPPHTVCQGPPPAEGGWGGVCVWYAPASRDSDEIPAIGADIWDDQDAEALGMSADAIHAHGSLAGLELYHGGASSPNGGSRAVRLAPSQLTSVVQWGGLAKEMDTADIACIQRNWVQAARRARDVGFDIVYVYGAHGYL